MHGGGLDPGWYDYPSLIFLALAPTQIGFDEPSYGAARVVAVLVGILGVAAAWWLGRAAYGTTAALTGAVGVAVATTGVAYSRMAVTDVFLTLGVTVTLGLLVTGRLEWAGVAAGLAASAKYPGVILVVPIVVAGIGAWRRVGIAVGLAVAAFVLTSPFVVIHAGAAWDDFHRVQDLARDGWLGFENDPATPFAFGLRLWETLGPVVLVAAVGIVIALRRRERADLILLSFGTAYALSLLASHAHFDRYVLPLVPVLAVLAGRGRALAIAALVAAVVPLWWSIEDARSLTGRDPRLDAAAWIDRTIPTTDPIAADPSTLPLTGRRVERLALPGPGRAVRHATESRRAPLRTASAGSSSAEASPTVCSRPPTTTRARRGSTVRSSACRRPTRHRRSLGAGRVRGSGSTASTLERWTAAGHGSTGSLLRPRCFSPAPCSSVSR